MANILALLRKIILVTVSVELQKLNEFGGFINKKFI